DYPEIMIPPREYEELLSLRVKRINNHKQLSSMDAKLKEYKKSINTLQASRDHWHAKADEAQEEVDLLSISLAPDWRGGFGTGGTCDNLGKTYATFTHT